MAVFDQHKNFAYSTVATAPSPASSGTSLVVGSGDGNKFPAASFNAVIWPAGAQPTTVNAEIVRVTTIATDTFTITRAQESSSARTVIVGDQIASGITVKSLTDMETLFPTGTVLGTTDTQTLTNKIVSDEFMGDVWDSQSALKESITLLASTDFLALELVEVGSTTVLEIPATSSLEIRTYIGIDQADIAGKMLHDTFQGDIFDNQSAVVRNITLDTNKDFLALESLDLGKQYVLEIPASSTLEVRAYIDNATTLTARNFYNPIKFSAYRNAAWTPNTSTLTKIAFDTKNFDTSNNFDAVVNSRFTAPIAGFYFFSSGIDFGNVSDTSSLQVALEKNGSPIRYGLTINQGGSSSVIATVSGVLKLNAGDFVEVFGFAAGSTAGVTGDGITCFDGFLVSAT